MGSLEDFVKTQNPKEYKKLVSDSTRLLQQAGYIVHKQAPPAAVAKLDVDRIRGNKVRIGIVSDMHFGSKFQQPTYLREHLAYMKKRGISALLVAGDVTDGSTQMHAGFEYEIFAHGADAQVDAACKYWPEKWNVPTFAIDGNHDWSHFKADGFDPVRAISKELGWTYLSPERDAGNKGGSIGYLDLNDLRIQVCHPHLGGTRQRSYRMELWVENLSPEAKPHVVVMGNFHKVLQMDYRNVFGLLVPSYQAQSNWMASKGIQSYIGGCIMELGSDPRGLAPSISVEWLIERVPVQGDW